MSMRSSDFFLLFLGFRKIGKACTATHASRLVLSFVKPIIDNSA